MLCASPIARTWLLARWHPVVHDFDCISLLSQGIFTPAAARAVPSTFLRESFEPLDASR